MLKEKGPNRFGIPYQGSKNGIAEEIIKLLPPADTFVDLFCGGCAMTHVAMLSGKYKNFILNDINPGMPNLFRDAVNGKYLNENRWFDKEDFNRLKDVDSFVAVLWSFGNNQKQYMYGVDTVAYKKAIHYAVFFRDYSLLLDMGFDLSFVDKFETPNERFKAIVSYFRGMQKRLEDSCVLEKDPEMQEKLKQLQKCQNLANLARLNGLNKLSALKFNSLQVYSQSYDTVHIPENSLIYCDPPYRNTAGYLCSFDFNKFDDWCVNNPNLLFISEYSMPEDRFETIFKIDKRKLFSSSPCRDIVEEKLFIPKNKIGMYTKPGLF